MCSLVVSISSWEKSEFSFKALFRARSFIFLLLDYENSLWMMHETLSRWTVFKYPSHAIGCLYVFLMV